MKPHDARGAGPAPRILLSATLRWPFAGRLAIGFASLGCRVEMLGPRGHPAQATGRLARLHRASAWRPLHALRAALEASAPAIVVPCDDTAAMHLAQLHALLTVGTGGTGDGGGGSGGAADAALRACIVRSLGAPQACVLATRRAALLAWAGSQGVRVPDTAELADAAALAGWLQQHRLPAVLKRDASWGGQGVEIVHDAAQARAAFARLSAPPSPGPALLHALLDRDPWTLAAALRGDAPQVSVQAHVAGVPANRAVACRQGQVLAGTSVLALHTQHATGPATVVRIVDNAEMAYTAARLVGRLGLSGLWGFDFVVDPLTRAATLIEVNPRATPICHLPLGAGHDPVAALCASLRGADAAGAARAVQPVAAIGGRLVALFPGEWQRDPAGAALREAHHDRPDAEPRFVRECLAPPWAERGLLARAWARLRPRVRPLPPPAPPVRQRTDPPALRLVQGPSTPPGAGAPRGPVIAIRRPWRATDESR